MSPKIERRIDKIELAVDAALAKQDLVIKQRNHFRSALSRIARGCFKTGVKCREIAVEAIHTTPRE
jgi:hypothetical protein